MDRFTSTLPPEELNPNVQHMNGAVPAMLEKLQPDMQDAHVQVTVVEDITKVVLNCGQQL